MCGIVGYVGDNPAKDILIDGLKRLEYRGYDSAGLAFLNKNQFNIVRAQGKLAELIKKISGQNHDAPIGIGHTRWATHGRPSEINAHPHHSKDIVLVHNGIIENYQVLKKELAAKGHKIVSETDSEIICHLIQDYLDAGLGFIDAFKKSLATLKGAFSIVLIHRQDPHSLYVAKKGSPLVIGVTGRESLVASDIPALLSYTNEMIFLDDGEMAILKKGQVEVFDFLGKAVKKRSKHITWSAAQAEKGGYKHFMLKEIMEQPRVFADTFLGRIEPEALTITLNGTDPFLRDFASKPHAKIQIIACGTSYHAGMVGKYWIEGLARLPVHVELASEFRYRKPVVDADMLLIVVSQSGETADTIASLCEGRSLGAKTLAVCNVVESSIPRQADATIYTHAGPEIGVASTKAFLTQLEVLYFIALKLAMLRGKLSAEGLAGRVQALLKLPDQMRVVLECRPRIQEIADKIYKKEHCYFLGRGLQFPVALEGALKLKEISYCHAEGYAGGEMKHGPIALIEEDAPVVAIAVRDGLYEKMASNVEEVCARGAAVYGLVPAGDTELAAKCRLTLELPETHPDLAPFLTILPLQLLAYEVADLKGTDVDQPRNLAKSVTVE